MTNKQFHNGRNPSKQEEDSKSESQSANMCGQKEKKEDIQSKGHIFL